MAEKTITRDQARAALECVASMVKMVAPALNAAPYSVARPAWGALDTLVESAASELGLELIGECEGCQAAVFDGDDHILTNDGCWLCSECRPSDEDLAALRAIQAACPECVAQDENDHDHCSPSAEAAEGADQ